MDGCMRFRLGYCQFTCICQLQVLDTSLVLQADNLEACGSLVHRMQISGFSTEQIHAVTSHKRLASKLSIFGQVCGALLVKCDDAQMRAAWRALDTDHSGTLSFAEFQRVLPLHQVMSSLKPQMHDIACIVSVLIG